MMTCKHLGMSCLVAGLASVCLAAVTPAAKAVPAKEKPAAQRAGAPEGAEGRPGAKYGKGQYHRAFMSRIKQGPIGIVFYGDSITEGVNSLGKESLLAKFDSYKPAVFGIGGEETQNLLYRLTTGEADIKPNPKVAVLMIGVNDISHNKGVKPEKVAEDIKRNVEVTREKMPETKLLLMSLLPFGKESSSPTRQKVSAVNEIIKKYADGKSIIYVDVHSTFLDANGTVKDGSMDAAALHPTEKGYQLWCEALLPVAEPFLKK
jgi:lysophospholipase L1-like esterase